MKAILIIAKKEIRSSLRNRMFMVILILFMLLSILSVYIGSTTKRAEMQLYNDSVASLTAQGVTAIPSAPEIHTLTILTNLIEYIGVVGAILSIILGFDTLIDEKLSGGIKLILTRPVYRDQLLTGKFLGKAAIITVLLGMVFLSNLILLVWIGGIFPTGIEVLRLATLLLLAFFYMLVFLALSILLSIHTKSSTNAFLIALVIWMACSFVIPQIAESQMANNTIVNNISGATTQIPQETTISHMINLLSPTWHLRNTGMVLMEAAPMNTQSSNQIWSIESLKAMSVLLGIDTALMALAYATFLHSETLTLE